MRTGWFSTTNIEYESLLEPIHCSSHLPHPNSLRFILILDSYLHLARTSPIQCLAMGYITNIQFLEEMTIIPAHPGSTQAITPGVKQQKYEAECLVASVPRLRIHGGILKSHSTMYCLIKKRHFTCPQLHLLLWSPPLSFYNDNRFFFWSSHPWLIILTEEQYKPEPHTIQFSASLQYQYLFQ